MYIKKKKLPAEWRDINHDCCFCYNLRRVLTLTSESKVYKSLNHSNFSQVVEKKLLYSLPQYCVFTPWEPFNTSHHKLTLWMAFLLATSSSTYNLQALNMFALTSESNPISLFFTVHCANIYLYIYFITNISIH